MGVSPAEGNGVIVVPRQEEPGPLHVQKLCTGGGFGVLTQQICWNPQTRKTADEKIGPGSNVGSWWRFMANFLGEAMKQ